MSPYNEENKDNLRTWASFATHWVLGADQKPITNSKGEKYKEDSSISLESWHDNIHGLFRTGDRYKGHKGDPAIAGVFILHIKGLVACSSICSLTPSFGCIIGEKAVFNTFQNLTISDSNIDRIFAIYQALYPQKWVPASGELNDSTSLYPFRKDVNKFWSSDEVRDWTNLGFAIPGNKSLDQEGVAALTTRLNEFYAW